MALKSHEFCDLANQLFIIQFVTLNFETAATGRHRLYRKIEIAVESTISQTFFYFPVANRSVFFQVLQLNKKPGDFLHKRVNFISEVYPKIIYKIKR